MLHHCPAILSSSSSLLPLFILLPQEEEEEEKKSLCCVYEKEEEEIIILVYYIRRKKRESIQSSSGENFSASRNHGGLTMKTSPGKGGTYPRDSIVVDGRSMASAVPLPGQRLLFSLRSRKPSAPYFHADAR